MSPADNGQTSDIRQPVCKKTKTAQQIRNYCKLENASDEHIRHTQTSLTVSHSAVRTETSLHTGEGAAEGIRHRRSAGTRWRTGRTTGLINQTVLTLQRWRHTTGHNIIHTKCIEVSWMGIITH